MSGQVRCGSAIVHGQGIGRKKESGAHSGRPLRQLRPPRATLRLQQPLPAAAPLPQCLDGLGEAWGMGRNTRHFPLRSLLLQTSRNMQKSEHWNELDACFIIPQSPNLKKILECREKNIYTKLWIALGEILAFPTGMLVQGPQGPYGQVQGQGAGGMDLRRCGRGLYRRRHPRHEAVLRLLRALVAEREDAARAALQRALVHKGPQMRQMRHTQQRLQTPKPLLKRCTGQTETARGLQAPVPYPPPSYFRPHPRPPPPSMCSGAGATREARAQGMSCLCSGSWVDTPLLASQLCIGPESRATAKSSTAQSVGLQVNKQYVCGRALGPSSLHPQARSVTNHKSGSAQEGGGVDARLTLTTGRSGPKAPLAPWGPLGGAGGWKGGGV